MQRVAFMHLIHIYVTIVIEEKEAITLKWGWNGETWEGWRQKGGWKKQCSHILIKNKLSALKEE